MRPTTPASAPQNGPSQQRHRRIGRRWLAVAVAAVGAASVAIAVQPSDGATAKSAPGYQQDDLHRDTDAIQALGITGVQARVASTSGRD
ncbi:hypothetical protein ACFW9W_41485, partial [Streptomyces sp. NPDC059468]